MKRGVIALACLSFVLAGAPAAVGGPLRTAVLDPTAFNGPNAARAFAETRATGATMVRLLLDWRAVASWRPPPGWNPEDPGDPNYQWARYDRQITLAKAAGLEPFVVILGAPPWAEGAGSGNPGTVRPDPVEFGRFARAAAQRYSGTFALDPYSEPFPRVRFWQVWTEPNRDYFLMPQYDSAGRLISPSWYRSMVNRMANAVHDVNPTNMVVAGGLAPLGKPGKPAPFTFMRSLLSAPVRFDIWAHHPYTSGGPSHQATNRNDAALGDLPEMRQTLGAAVRAGRVLSSGTVDFWVTEFSWDSNPPDPRGLPPALHARWTAEAMYRMWKSGVTVVTWFRVRDDPLRETPYQSGLYRTNGAAKLSLRAFRFPVVALRKRGGIFVWGRMTASVQGTVAVELTTGRAWRRIGTLRSNAWGIFSRTYRTPVRKGRLRARNLATGELSLPFSLTPVRDRFVNPFGCGGGIPC
jgi:hypothetical protein